MIGSVMLSATSRVIWAANYEQPRVENCIHARPKRSRSRPASPPTSTPSFFHGWTCLWFIGITSAPCGWTLDFPIVFDDINYLQQNPLFLDSQSFSFPFHYQEFLQKPGKIGFDPDWR
jgi:hypothetical protein